MPLDAKFDVKKLRYYGSTLDSEGNAKNRASKVRGRTVTQMLKYYPHFGGHFLVFALRMRCQTPLPKWCLTYIISIYVKHISNSLFDI